MASIVITEQDQEALAYILQRFLAADPEGTSDEADFACRTLFYMGKVA